MSFDPHIIRADFPILSTKVHGKPLVYLDNAASAQKPKVVIDRMVEVMEQGYANVHRGLHHLSAKATADFEQGRESIARFLSVDDPDEIILTKGATEAINLVAHSWAWDRLDEGDEIVLSVLEHHSNIVPWHFLRERKGVVLKWVDIQDDGSLDLESFEAALSDRTKLVAITHMSNALGVKTPIETIIAKAKERGIPVLIDGCQAAPHLPLNVPALGADFYVFSGHKVYGPTGIGALWAKKETLEAMRPYQGGGEMIDQVTRDQITYGKVPHKFEAGTPAIIEAIGLGAALDYFMAQDRDAILAHEQALYDHAVEALSGLNSVRLYGTAKDKGAILSFNIEGVHSSDVATLIDRAGVAVRSGHHCAQPLMEALGVDSTARASFAMYNTHEDVEAFAAAVHKAQGLLAA